MGWDNVETALPGAKALVTDGCHKTYVAMDDGAVEMFREYGYGVGDDGSLLVLLDTPEKRSAALGTLRDWFDQSCGLRFIDGVASGGTDRPTFSTLIGQFEYDEEG